MIFYECTSFVKCAC